MVFRRKKKSISRRRKPSTRMSKSRRTRSRKAKINGMQVVLFKGSNQYPVPREFFTKFRGHHFLIWS